MADSMLDIATRMGNGLDATARAFRTAVRDIAKDGAKVAREEHRAAAASVTGGDGRYSGLGAAGRLDIRIRYDDDGALIIPKGAWKIAQEGAAAHSIKPRKGKALKLAGGEIRQEPLNHPGTAASQGKQAWTKAERATIERLDKDAPAKVDRAVAEAFHRG